MNNLNLKNTSYDEILKEYKKTKEFNDSIFLDSSLLELIGGKGKSKLAKKMKKGSKKKRKKGKKGSKKGKKKRNNDSDSDDSDSDACLLPASYTPVHACCLLLCAVENLARSALFLLPDPVHSCANWSPRNSPLLSQSPLERAFP